MKYAAEEVVQDALLAAWQQWQADGLSDRPGAWLWTVARRRAIDLLRREARYRERAPAVSFPARQADEDDRLMLIFTCCHPALAAEAQVALTLRTVCGLSTAEIARAFLVSETAIVQRLTRARRKISAAGIPYRVPADEELGQRLSGVLAVIYLLFNEGYLCSASDVPQRRDLTDEAEWLAVLLARLMPSEPEVVGLLALIRLHRARAAARFDSEDRLVLRHQDRAPSWDATDWTQILLLYDALLCHQPSPVTRLHRAVALGQVLGPRAALAETDALARDLDHYHLYHATRAEFLRELGRPAQARQADERALGLTGNPAERALLEQRLA